MFCCSAAQTRMAEGDGAQSVSSSGAAFQTDVWREKPELPLCKKPLRSAVRAHARRWLGTASVSRVGCTSAKSSNYYTACVCRGMCVCVCV